MKPDLSSTDKTPTQRSGKDSQDAPLEPRSFATKVIKRSNPSTGVKCAQYAGKSVRRPSTSGLRTSLSGDDEPSCSASEMQVDNDTEIDAQSVPQLMHSSLGDDGRDTSIRSDDDAKADIMTIDPSADNRTASLPRTLQRRPTCPKPQQYPNADIALPLPRLLNPPTFPLPAHVVRSISSSHTRPLETIELAERAFPISTAPHATLSSGYTSLVSTFHGRHPELSAPVFRHAAYILGERTSSLSPVVNGSQRGKGGSTFDAPMDDKKDPAYLGVMTDEAVVYMPHTGLYKGSPSMAFPMVTQLSKSGVVKGKGVDQLCANGQGKRTKGENGSIRGGNTDGCEEESRKKGKKKQKEKKAFQDKEYLLRQVIVPLEGGDAIVFPDKLFEEMAFERDDTGQSDARIETSAVDSTGSEQVTNAPSTSTDKTLKAPKLIGTMHPLNFHPQPACPSSIHPASNESVSFRLTQLPHLRARSRLWNVLEEQICPRHLPSSLPCTSLLPSSAASLLAPIGPAAECADCTSQLDTLIRFHAHCDSIAELHCGKEGHEEGKEDRTDCRLCMREVKVGKAVEQRVMTGRARYDPQEELEEAKRRYVEEWPEVWEVDARRWREMRERGVYVLRASELAEARISEPTGPSGSDETACT